MFLRSQSAALSPTTSLKAFPAPAAPGCPPDPRPLSAYAQVSLPAQSDGRGALLEHACGGRCGPGTRAKLLPVCLCNQ